MKILATLKLEALGSFRIPTPPPLPQNGHEGRIANPPALCTNIKPAGADGRRRFSLFPLALELASVGLFQPLMSWQALPPVKRAQYSHLNAGAGKTKPPSVVACVCPDRG